MTMRKNLTPEQQEEYKQKKREIAAEWQRNNPDRAKQRKQDWYNENRELTIRRATLRKEKTRKGPRVILTPEQREVNRKKYMGKYYAANKSVIIDRWLVNKKEYMKNPLYRLKEAMRYRVNAAISSRGYTKKSKTFTILGCTFDEFVVHIESQFIDGMSWDNKDEWHIDHKVPVSVAQNEQEILRLNHYSNLRPLYAKDNFEKGDKMLAEFVPLRIELLGW